MGLKVPNTDEIEREIMRVYSAMRDDIVAILPYAGETAISYVRNEHPNNWNDITGNLRNSVGYGIYLDGQEVQMSQMNTEGTALCRQIGEQSREASLVLVAGMEYAEYVQAKGRDVLAGGSIEAEKTTESLIRQLEQRINDQ